LTLSTCVDLGTTSRASRPQLRNVTRAAAMAYTDDAVLAKLSALNETQESIVTVAQWVMFHRYKAIANGIWSPKADVPKQETCGSDRTALATALERFWK
jgi:hypothetical protein